MFNDIRSEKQVVKVRYHKAASSPRTDSSVVFATMCHCAHFVYRVVQKQRGHKLWPLFYHILTDFKNVFTGRFLDKFAGGGAVKKQKTGD